MKKKILLVILIILIGIQFIRPAKNESKDVLMSDITNVYTVPQDVSDILKRSCYDCHSNNTVYPWYFNIQPVAWWLNNHIEEGKNELNFSEFGSYSLGRQYHKFDGITEQVKKDEMPLWSYTLIHTYAKLSDAQKQTLINWCQNMRDTMKAKYPADSLVMKKRPDQH